MKGYRDSIHRAVWLGSVEDVCVKCAGWKLGVVRRSDDGQRWGVVLDGKRGLGELRGSYASLSIFYQPLNDAPSPVTKRGVRENSQRKQRMRQRGRRNMEGLVVVVQALEGREQE